MSPANPLKSGSTTGSGRNAGTMRAFQPESRIAWCAVSGSSGDSVVEQHLDIELFVKSPRQIFGRRQLSRNGVEIQVRRFLAQPLRQAKLLLKRVIQPNPCGRAAEQVVVLGKNAPHLPRILHHRLPDFEIVHRDALAVQHAKDVVVGLHQQRRRIGKRLVVGKPCRLGMPVRAHNGQVADVCIQRTGYFKGA